ncbi:MAG: protein-L-isoaspartate(D-aspartate) O-methyltransferase [Alphaproteobacteria bacterium]
MNRDAAAVEAGFSERCRALIAEIEADMVELEGRLGKGALDPRVMSAMASVPRHEFVARDQWDRAYDNAPLPIGFGQTISQPFIVALMTDMLAPKSTDRILEIGTGCGYQCAVLARLAQTVFSVEIVPELAEAARQRLKRLGFANVEIRAGDGRNGWPEQAPFDAIIVTAAAREVPPALLQQLKPGGRMAIPLGGRMLGQDLVLVRKDESGAVTERVILPVAFVPLVRGKES